MSGPVADIGLPRFERRLGGLRARLEVAIDGRAPFTAFADISPDGRLLDLQASDCACVGTTGIAELDAAIARLVEEEVVRARNAAVVADLDRHMRRRR